MHFVVNFMCRVTVKLITTFCFLNNNTYLLHYSHVMHNNDTTWFGMFAGSVGFSVRRKHSIGLWQMMNAVISMAVSGFPVDAVGLTFRGHSPQSTSSDFDRSRISGPFAFSSSSVTVVSLSNYSEWSKIANLSCLTCIWRPLLMLPTMEFLAGSSAWQVPAVANKPAWPNRAVDRAWWSLW